MRRQFPFSCLTLGALALGLCVTSARAATFTVFSTNDSGAGTLRQAILDANALPGADAIRIDGFAGVATFNSPLPDITDDLSIDGIDDGQGLLLQPNGDFRVFNVPRANLLLANIEISGGVAEEGRGGGIYNDGGTVSLDSATITANQSAQGGGGIFNKAGTLKGINSIVALNVANGAVRGPDIIGSFNSQGFNLIGVAPTNFVARSGDLSGTNANPLDPQLGDFRFNGGSTFTRLPRSGSPVIDAGNTAATADQRGVARPQGARKDIGAVEVVGAPKSANPAVFAPSKSGSGGAS